MKKFVSRFPKRAGEIVELVDDVLDEGLSLHPDDDGFVELKELRDQMFAIRTFTKKLCKYQEEAKETYANCHTPSNGRTQNDDVNTDGDEIPFTQLCIELSKKVCAEFRNETNPIRLNFDDCEDLDLNVTQPPATQGKEVENGQNSEDVPEFKMPVQPKRASPKDGSTIRSLSRFGREYLLSEKKSVIPVCPKPKPLNVVDPLVPQRRPRWSVVLPEVLRSPYVVREVSLMCGMFPHQKRVDDCLFIARLT